MADVTVVTSPLHSLTRSGEESTGVSMSEANRGAVEAKAYRENLEALVTARTEQLREAVQKNSDLLEFLKQIQSMQSLNEIHQAVQVEIAKLETQSATS